MKFQSILVVLICSITMFICSLTFFFTLGINENIDAVQNKIISAVRVLYPKSGSETQETLEIIAKNKRIASIISYSLSESQSLSSHYQFVKKLESELRSDIIADMAYDNLKEAGSTTTQMAQLDETRFLFRGRWPLTIKPGSYFFDKPVKRVLFINESFKAPICDTSKGYEPFVIYQSTNQNHSVELIYETKGQTLEFRAIAKDKDGTPILFNSEDRILIDAGCTDPNRPLK
ncbi:hypothetical protein ACE25E_002722 [Vibrio cholerae]